MTNFTLSIIGWDHSDTHLVKFFVKNGEITNVILLFVQVYCTLRHVNKKETLIVY